MSRYIRPVHTVSIDFDAVIGTSEVCISFTRRTTWSYDPHYGSDADGNRGMPLTSIDEDWGDNVTATYYSGLVVSADLLQDAVDCYIATYEPEPPEEREQDGDDQEDE